MLRGISVSMWNVHHDIDTAIKTITKALSINLTSENKTKLNADFSKLKELKKKEMK